MIPGFDPIAINHVTFAALSAMVVMVAWSGGGQRFLAVLAAAGMVMLASWLRFIDALALLLFLVPPYLLIRAHWGRGGGVGGAAAAMISWQVALFVVLRRYEPLDRWIDHPISVIGLSYMLFRVLHLLIEAPALGRHPLNPLRYFVYVTAFWTLLAGPIQRYDDFTVQLARANRPGTPESLAASHRIVNGLIKTFLLAPVFLGASSLEYLRAAEAGWVDGAVVFFAYPFYLYLNFSGYTDVVIGIAGLCGVALPENFNNPFLSRNIQEFWGRWHISFGVWIRTYIFTPLCKLLLTRSRGRHADLLTAISVIVTFVAVGLWHGTTARFLVFGLAHGLAIVAQGVWGGLLKASLGKEGRKTFIAHPVTRWGSTVLTFLFVCLTMQAFASPLADIWEAWSAFLRSRP